MGQIDRAARILDALGGSPDEIERSLMRMPVWGIKKDENYCVIAACLQKATGKVWCVRDTVHLKNTNWHRKVDEILISDPLREFIEDFDRGEYPELEG